MSIINPDNKLTINKSSGKMDEIIEVKYVVTNGSRTNNANITIDCSNSNDYLSVTNDFSNNSLASASSRTGTLKIKVLQDFSDSNKEVSCTVFGLKGDRNISTTPPASKVCRINRPHTISKGNITLEDKDCSGAISKNDMLTIGSESFYVYDVDDGIKAIAANNLNVGSECINSTCTEILNPTGLQYANLLTTNGHFYGVTPFSNETYHGDNFNSYRGSLVEKYVNEYKEKLSSMNDNIDTVRLITKQELLDLGCDGTTCSSSIPSYIYSSNYWTMTSYGESSTTVYMMIWQGGTSGGLYNASYDYKTQFGIRPVIEINKSLFD